MISGAGVDRLVAELRFEAGGPGWPLRAGGPTPGLRAALDFGSAERWPDLPYDTAAAESRYGGPLQTALRGVLVAAAARLAEQAPAARAFVDGQLQHVLLRRSDRVPTAASGSHRTAIGRCILTNLHLEADPAAVAIEALVHESVHQRLYRLEGDQGAFCELGGPVVLRSPWTGARLPLHSLVHATFVWFALARLWSALGRATRGDAHAARRLASCRYGFQFLGDVVDAPSFPRASVAPCVYEAMGRLAAEALRPAHRANGLRAAMHAA